MIMRNGRTSVGWRLDDCGEGMKTGFDLLMNPFAIVPDDKNADAIVSAFEERDRYKKALEELQMRHQSSSDPDHEIIFVALNPRI